MSSAREQPSAFVARLVFPVDQGMLMFEDPSSAYPHENWFDGDVFVDAGRDSVYLAVQPSVDGPVDVTVSRSLVHDTSDGSLYFEGVIETGSGQLVLHDGNDFLRFAVPLPTSSVEVKIYVDQPGLASKMYLDLGLDD
jgi:hypothetical protein